MNIQIARPATRKPHLMAHDFPQRVRTPLSFTISMDSPKLESLKVRLPHVMCRTLITASKYTSINSSSRISQAMTNLNFEKGSGPFCKQRNREN